MSQDALCFIRKCSLHFKGEISKTLEESGTSPPYGSPPCFNNECEKKEKVRMGFLLDTGTMEKLLKEGMARMATLVIPAWIS